MSSSSQSQPPRRSPLAATLGWGFVWLAGTSAVAAYSVTQHTPALEGAMLDSVQDAIAPLSDSPIMVSVSDHAATLSGSVPDLKTRDALLSAAGSSLGIRQVVDRLTPAGTLTAADADASGDRDAAATANIVTPPAVTTALSTKGVPLIAPEVQADEQGDVDAEPLSEPTREPTRERTRESSGEQAAEPVDDLDAALPPEELLGDALIGVELPGDELPGEADFDADASEAIDADADSDALAASDLPSEDLLPPDPFETSGDEPVDAADAELVVADASPAPDQNLGSQTDDPKSDPDGALEEMPLDGGALEDELPEDELPEDELPEDELPEDEQLEDEQLEDNAREDEAVEDSAQSDAETPLTSPSLRLELVERRLTIEGTMADADDAAARVLEALDDIELDSVSNSLESGDGVASAEWLGTVATLFATMIELDEPAMHVVNGEVVLLGTAETDAIRETVVEEARRRLGEQPMIDQINVISTSARSSNADDTTTDTDTETDTPDAGAQPEAPLATAPEPAAPEGAALESAATEGTATEGAAPRSATAETATPEVAAPKTAIAEITAAEIDASEADAAETDAPETDAPGTSAPEIAAPEISAPEISAPEIQAPDQVVEDGAVAVPGVATDVDASTAAESDVANSDLSPTTALRTAFASRNYDKILFENDSANLTTQSRIIVNRIADLLRGHPGVPLAIEGHTDGVGLREDNLELSQLRANAVRDQLVSRGISRSRITTYGYGEGVPVADNSTPAGRAANRRIEFTF